MSFAYLPLYTGDYVRDTQHLSCSEHGIYLKLLMHCWDQKGPAPLDERKLVGIVNARSTDEIEAMRRVLAEFFVCMEDGHYNRRMQQEIERCENISRERSDAGRKGYEAKAKQLLSKCQASAKQVPLSPSPSPSLTPIQKEEVSAAALRAASPPPPFDGDNESQIPSRAVVQLAPTWGLPEAWGQDAEALGWANGSILKESERFRQYWVTGKGAGKRRSLKGWRQAWSNWLGKAERMSA